MMFFSSMDCMARMTCWLTFYTHSLNITSMWARHRWWYPVTLNSWVHFSLKSSDNNVLPCQQSAGERNYHIFYEMLSGLREDQKIKLSLTKAEDFVYLNQVHLYMYYKANQNIRFVKCNCVVLLPMYTISSYLLGWEKKKSATCWIWLIKENNICCIFIRFIQRTDHGNVLVQIKHNLQHWPVIYMYWSFTLIYSFLSPWSTAPTCYRDINYSNFFSQGRAMFIAARNPRSYFQQVIQSMDALGISVSFFAQNLHPLISAYFAV